MFPHWPQHFPDIFVSLVSVSGPGWSQTWPHLPGYNLFIIFLFYEMGECEVTGRWEQETFINFNIVIGVHWVCWVQMVILNLTRTTCYVCFGGEIHLNTELTHIYHQRNVNVISNILIFLYSIFKFRVQMSSNSWEDLDKHCNFVSRATRIMSLSVPV